MPQFVFTLRTYLHVDYPRSATVAEQWVTNPTAIGYHAFLPFIRYTVWTQKIRKRRGGGVEQLPRKARPIEYAGHLDAQIFSYYSDILEEAYEQELTRLGLGRTVTAFRPIGGMCNVHFANEAFEFIRRSGPCSVLATDISNYFGAIRHDRLKAAWRDLLAVERLPLDHFKVFTAITKYSWVERERLCEALNLDPENPRADGRRRYCSIREFRNLVRANGLVETNRSGVGIPQGSPISAVLSNLYLLEFDTTMAAFVHRAGGLYRRYCDDVLMVLPSAALRDEARLLMAQLLQELGLRPHPEKTELVDFTLNGERLFTRKPLNYLGFTFDGENKRIRSASVARYYRRMKCGVGRIKALRFRASAAVGTWLPLRLRKLYLAYSYVGRRNFISYALRAARIMQDPGIKWQVRSHWKKLQALLHATA